MKKEAKVSCWKEKGRWALITILSLVVIHFLLVNFSYLFGMDQIVFSLSNLIFSVLIIGFVYFMDCKFDIEFKKRHYFFAAFIVLSGWMLSPLYSAYINYDKVLHFFQPMMLSSIILHMMKKAEIKPKWKIVLTFFIVTSLIGLFEIAEFGLDRLFNMQLQGVFLSGLKKANKLHMIMDPLSDTHMDLIVGYLGSLIYAVFMTISLRKHKRIFTQ